MCGWFSDALCLDFWGRVHWDLPPDAPILPHAQGTVGSRVCGGEGTKGEEGKQEGKCPGIHKVRTDRETL